MLKKITILTIMAFSFLMAEHNVTEAYIQELVQNLKEKSPDTYPSENNYVLNFLSDKQKAVYLEQVKLLKKANKKIPTIFYLTSKSMGEKPIQLFNNDIERIKKEYDIQGLTVFRGVTPDFKEFVLGKIYQNKTNFQIKIHPMIFKKFKAKEVPLFVLSYCKKGENFRFRDCENKFMATGDATLADFLFKVSNVDKKYDKYYFSLVKPR